MLLRPGSSILRGMHTRHALLVVLLVLTTLGASPAWAGATPDHGDVAGSFVSTIPCIPTAWDASTGHTTCVGSSTWTGSLTGVSTYTVEADVDPVTGAGSGTIVETFTGRDTSGRVGTLHFSESFSLWATGIPDVGAMAITARVDGAGGDFAGTRGTIRFFGTNTLACNAGGYEGRLTRWGR